jgi:hypothetical protein
MARARHMMPTVILARAKIVVLASLMARTNSLRPASVYGSRYSYDAC